MPFIPKMEPGHLPTPGNVMSMSGPGQNDLGHTGVVASVEAPGGNGTITVYDENGNPSASNLGYGTIIVTNWQMATTGQPPYHYTVFEWTAQRSVSNTEVVSPTPVRQEPRAVPSRHRPRAAHVRRKASARCHRRERTGAARANAKCASQPRTPPKGRASRGRERSNPRSRKSRTLGLNARNL
jgi:hypothetical protein